MKGFIIGVYYFFINLTFISFSFIRLYGFNGPNIWYVMLFVILFFLFCLATVLFKCSQRDCGDVQDNIVVCDEDDNDTDDIDTSESMTLLTSSV